LIGDSSCPARDELVLCLIWIVGEYISEAVMKITGDLLNDYHESLELFAYERMSMAKLGMSNSEDGRMDQASKTHTTRLMLVVISALSKLAARWQPIASRVMLCLAKVLKQSIFFDKAVIQRATECITILKFPSIAASILDSPHKIGKKGDSCG